MSRKALIERQRHRLRYVQKYRIKRQNLKKKIQEARSLDQRFQFQQKLISIINKT